MGPVAAEAGDDVKTDPAPIAPAEAGPGPAGAGPAGPGLAVPGPAGPGLADPGLAGAEPAPADPRENTFDPIAMKVPHAPQNMRPGGLGASQSQHVSVGAGDSRSCGAAGGKG
jgi:hypothetical protein